VDALERLLRTLIVDDSQIACEALKLELEAFDVQLVDTCESGERALELLDQVKAHYDAIFVDLHMDGMDGIELIRELHERHYRGGVVIVSALDESIVQHTSEVVRKLHLQLLGSISKPFDRSLVAFMVRRIKNLQPASLDLLPVSKSFVRNAIDEQRVLPYFQPLIDGTNNSLLGLEALSRLVDKSGKVLLPNQFLPTIERFDLFNEFMPSFLRIALRQYKKISTRLNIDANLRVNLSASQLENPRLPDLLLSHVHEAELEPNQLTLEVSEKFDQSDVQLSNLGRLRIAGFTLSLDEYGAGFTNLRQLQTLPIDELKLDRELVNGMHRDKALRTIVESIKQVADQHDVRVVANGVHDPSDLILLDSLGLRYYQGHFFSRPKPVGECIRWLRSWRNTLNEAARHDLPSRSR